MRIEKIIMPVGWPVSLDACPPGPFIPVDLPDSLCFKSEYCRDGVEDIYNAAGEYYHTETMEVLVQPVEMIIRESED